MLLVVLLYSYTTSVDGLVFWLLFCRCEREMSTTVWPGQPKRRLATNYHSLRADSTPNHKFWCYFQESVPARHLFIFHITILEDVPLGGTLTGGRV